MNVKISEEAITFKVTEEEMKTLLSGSVLKSDVRIGPDRFTIKIDPTEESDDIPPVLHPILQERALVLKTTAQTVQDLSALGKNKEGLSSISTNGMKVVLQVDVRKRQ